MSGTRVPAKGKGKHKDDVCYVRDAATWRRVRETIFRGKYVAILGSKFCGKTLLLQDVVESFEEEICYCIYLDLGSLHVLQISSLFQQLARALHSAVLEADRLDLSLAVDEVRDGQDFRYLLIPLLASSSRPVLVALDHIEALPQYLAKTLLRCFRVIYNERDVHHEYRKIIVLTAGALNLFALTVSKVSPFNIAHPISLADMDNEQSQILVDRMAKCLGTRFSANAISRIIEVTEGDRYLIRRLCRLSAAEKGDGQAGRVSLRKVNRAVDGLIALSPNAEPCLGEMVRAIEAKPFILETVLEVLGGQQVRRRELLTEIGELELTGALKIVGHQYTMRNELYARFLQRHLDSQRVARILSTAGRWDEAVRYFEQGDLLAEVTERADYLAAVVSRIYAETDDVQAFHYMAQALERGFGVYDVVAYSHDERGKQLVPVVYGLQDGLGQIEPIHLYEKSHRIEARAFYGGDYLLEEDENGNALLVFPLRSPAGLTVGTVTLCNRFPIDHFVEHREEVLEIAGFLSQAAQAIATIREKQALFQREQQRAQELEGLNEVALIMTAALDTKELLAKIVESAWKVAGADYVGVVLVGKDGTLDTSVDDFQDVPPLHLRARGQGKTREVIHTAKPIVVDSVSAGDSSEHNPAIVGAGVESYAGFPIMSRGRVLGVLFVYNRHPGAFREQIPLLTTFANQAAVALENAQLFEEIQRRLRELNSLFEVGRNINTVLDEDQLLRIIVEAAVQAIPTADKGSMHLLDEGGGRLTIRASVGYGLEVAKVVRLRIGEGLAGLVVQTGQPLIVENFHTDSRVVWHDAHPDIAEIKSSVCAPLATRERTVIGALSVDSVQQIGAFSAEDARLLSVLANQAAIAIENARLHTDTERKATQLNTLLKISQDITAQLELNPVLARIVKYALEQLKADVVILRTYDHRKDQFEEPVFAGSLYQEEIEKEKVVTKDSVIYKVIHRDEPYYADDAEHDPIMTREFTKRERIKASVGCPLKVGGEPVGVMFVNYRVPHRFTEVEKSAISLFAQSAGIAIQNAWQYQSVSEKLETASATAMFLSAMSAWSHEVAQDTFILRTDAKALRECIAQPDDQIRSILDKIESKADAIANIIPDLPSSDIEKGEFIKLSSIFEDLRERREEEIASHYIEVESDLEALPPIYTNSQLLSEALDHLISNAIKAMPQGGKLTVRGKVIGKRVLVEVGDTGIGMPMKIQKQLFKGRVLGRDKSRTGIGLMLARMYINQCGGDIMLARSDEKGSIFALDLPFVSTDGSDLSHELFEEEA
jgi:GAF domain-containing protein/two-component sensor histidine kinase